MYMSHKPTARVLNILSLLSGQPKGLSLAQLSTTLDIPKSTLSPILQEMVYQNYLYIEPDKNRYCIGITTKFVGSAYDPQREIIPLIKHEMRKITAETHEICQLGILEGADVFYLLKEEPQQKFEIQILSYVGKTLPAYCTALGKALLAEKDFAAVRGLYPEGLKAQTPHTITDFTLLEAQLSEIRETNIAYEREEVCSYACCYATPLHISQEKTLALSVTMPIFRADDEKIALVKSLLLSAKRKIEENSYQNSTP